MLLVERQIDHSHHSLGLIYRLWHNGLTLRNIAETWVEAISQGVNAVIFFKPVYNPNSSAVAEEGGSKSTGGDMWVCGCGCVCARTLVSVSVHTCFAFLNCCVCPWNKSCAARAGLCVLGAPVGESEQLPCTAASLVFLLKTSFRNVFVYGKHGQIVTNPPSSSKLTCGYWRMEIVDASSFLGNGTNITDFLCDIILENDTFFCVDDAPYPSKGMYGKLTFFRQF